MYIYIYTYMGQSHSYHQQKKFDGTTLRVFFTLFTLKLMPLKFIIRFFRNEIRNETPEIGDGLLWFINVYYGLLFLWMPQNFTGKHGWQPATYQSLASF